jgi:hypothetical protein
MKFNLMVSLGLRTYIRSAETDQEAADRFRQEMAIQSKHGNGDLRPAIVAAIVAIASAAGIIFDDFGPSNASQDGGRARMITAEAASRAGAIEIPSELPSTFRLAGGQVIR